MFQVYEVNSYLAVVIYVLEKASLWTQLAGPCNMPLKILIAGRGFLFVKLLQECI
jgi:hypothetical protein